MQEAMRLAQQNMTQQRRIDVAARGASNVILWPMSEGFPWEKLAFGYLLDSPVVTIYAGTIRMHGSIIIAVSQDDITLTGTTDWVYVQHVRDSAAGTIQHTGTEPETTSTHLRVPLYKFTADAGVYSLAQICHMGDINFDTPLR